MHDLVIRNALIVDGSGAERFTGDVAVDGLGHWGRGGRGSSDGERVEVQPELRRETTLNLVQWIY